LSVPWSVTITDPITLAQPARTATRQQHIDFVKLARKKLADLGGRVPPMLSVADAQKEYERQTVRLRTIAKSIQLEPQ
jgi:hypothetical protein